jgi:hypothetical protein
MITLFEIITMIGGIILWAVPRSNIAAILVGYCKIPLPSVRLKNRSLLLRSHVPQRP